jgi:hypothetical protein
LVFTTGGRESARTERGDEPQAETNSIPTVDARSAARVISTGSIIARIGCLPTGNADMILVVSSAAPERESRPSSRTPTARGGQLVEQTCSLRLVILYTVRLQRPRTLAIATGLLGAALALSACGSSTPKDGSQAAITYKKLGATEGNLLAGELHGDRASGCLWLQTRGTVGPQQIHLYGPYSVSWKHGLKLYSQGRLVARDGEVATFSGGALHDGPAIPGCPVAGHPGSLRLS